MRAVARAVLVGVVVTLLAVPAAAGTPDDPEMVDHHCGGTAGDTGRLVYVIPESIDLCRGWFETLSDADATPEIRVTLQTAADVADRPPATIQTWWHSGDCSFTVFVDDSTEASISQGLRVGCGAPPPRTCTVPELSLDCRYADYYRDFALPDDAVVEDGEEIRFTVRFDGELAEFAADHEHGAALVGFDALTSVVVGPVYAWTFGCTNGLGSLDRCDEVNGDWMFGVKDAYVVGT